MTTRQVRGPAVRERLLDAAETLFYEHGITGTGVDAVLREAGVSTATLYAHFGGKDALVAAYLERRLARWRQVWADAVDAAADAGGEAARGLRRAGSVPRRPAGSARLRGPGGRRRAPRPRPPGARRRRVGHRLPARAAAALAADVGVPDPAELAEEVLLVYDGTLSAFLRGPVGDPSRGDAPSPACVRGRTS